jgi:hypothetical protein
MRSVHTTFLYYKKNDIWFEFHVKYRLYWNDMNQNYIYLTTFSVDPHYKIKSKSIQQFHRWDTYMEGQILPHHAFV